MGWRKGLISVENVPIMYSECGTIEDLPFLCPSRGFPTTGRSSGAALKSGTPFSLGR